jgi:thiol-disulfide isomerase/thioredoxin
MMKRFLVGMMVFSILVLLSGCQKDQSNSFVQKFKPKMQELSQSAHNIKSREQYMSFLQKADSLYSQMKSELKDNYGPEAKAMVADLAMSLKKINEAAALYQSIIDQNPDMKADSIYIGAAYAYLMLDSMNLARKYLEKSMEFTTNPGPKDELAVYVIDHVLTTQGKDEALKLAQSYKEKVKKAQKISDKIEALQLIGNKAPELKDVMQWVNTRRSLSLDQLKGKVLILDFWATWCNPCRRSIPSLINLRNHLKKKNFEVVGVTKVYGTFSDGKQQIENVKPKEEAKLIKKFIKEMKMSYPIAIAKSNTNLDAYRVRGIPTFFVVDKKGVIRDMFVGFSPQTEMKLMQKVMQLLDE